MESIVTGTLPYFLGMDLADLSEGVPLPGTGGIVEFMAEARELEGALREAGIDLSKTTDRRARALFLMRVFLPSRRVPGRGGRTEHPAG